MKKPKLTPAALFLVTFSSGTVLELFIPTNLQTYVPFMPLNIIGIALLLLGLGITVSAHRSFKQRHTPYEPFAKPTALITTGIYAISRNPIYLAPVICHIAMGFVLSSIWLTLFALLLLVFLECTIVPAEEHTLKTAFGIDYEIYCKNCRRWL